MHGNPWDIVSARCTWSKTWLFMSMYVRVIKGGNGSVCLCKTFRNLGYLLPSTKNGSSWFRYQKTKVKINTCLIKKNVLDDEVNYKEEIF